jgi:hypothetical protein
VRRTGAAERGARNRAAERRAGGGQAGLDTVGSLPAPPPLEDALVICLLLLAQEPERYERASVRWLGRLLLERPA